MATVESGSKFGSCAVFFSMEATKPITKVPTFCVMLYQVVWRIIAFRWPSLSSLKYSSKAGIIEYIKPGACALVAPARLAKTVKERQNILLIIFLSSGETFLVIFMRKSPPLLPFDQSFLSE